jgi:hypothetical protein
MYSREEASVLRQAFWTVFGQYMAPVLSAEGDKINWISYKTGEKNIHFKMNATNRHATIAIIITHSDKDLQQLFYEQFLQSKEALHAAMQEEWIWTLHTADEHEKVISKIYTELQEVNIFNKKDWPALISFFKPRIVALDEFWSSAKYVFASLHF